MYSTFERMTPGQLLQSQTQRKNGIEVGCCSAKKMLLDGLPIQRARQPSYAFSSGTRDVHPAVHFQCIVSCSPWR